MTIFLIGFMGCGKTTIGKKLAKKLGYTFLDLDFEIEKQEQSTIAKIFELNGEEYFRNLEHQFLTSFNPKNNIVISCGGGTPCFFNNMEMMNHIGYTVYIQMKPEALYSRLKDALTTRPLLQNKTEIELKKYIHDKLSEREPYYLNAQLITNGLSININQLADTFMKR